MKKRLSDDGFFIGNFAGDLVKKKPSFIWSEIKTFRQIFPNSYFFAVDSPHLESPQNIIFLGINGSEKIDFDSPAITKNNNPILQNIGQKNIVVDESQLLQYQNLTDNFAPVEYLIRTSISRWY